jgi:protein-L-isoaspartate(D-aspartate) O-methyltransferase
LIATGFLAWAEAGPFDAVIVNEEKQEPAVFERLIQLLRPGGRLVIPSSGQGIGAVSVIERGENGEAIHVL